MSITFAAVRQIGARFRPVPLAADAKMSLPGQCCRKFLHAIGIWSETEAAVPRPIACVRTRMAITRHRLLGSHPLEITTVWT